MIYPSQLWAPLYMSVRRESPVLSQAGHEGFCGKWSGAWTKWGPECLPVIWRVTYRSPCIVLLCSLSFHQMLPQCDFHSIHPGSTCFMCSSQHASWSWNFQNSLTHCQGVAFFPQVFLRGTHFFQHLRFGTLCTHRITLNSLTFPNPIRMHP